MDGHSGSARPGSGAKRWMARALATVATVAALAAGLTSLATPVSASWPTITGSAECASEAGMVTVDYTTTTWKTTGEPLPNEWQYYIAESDIEADDTIPLTFHEQYKGHIRLDYTTPDGSRPLIRDDIEFTPVNKGVVTGSVDIPEDQFPITLRARDIGRWKDNRTGRSEKTAVIEAPPGGCTPDVGEPAATSAYECGDDAIVVTLDNSASTVANDFQVTARGDEWFDVGDVLTLEPGATQTVEIASPDDIGSPIVVEVSGGDALLVIHEARYEPCPPAAVAPAASSSWECDDETIAVTLDNSASDVAVTFESTAISEVGVLSVTTTVAAGAIDTSVSFPGPATDGGPTAVTVTVDDDELHSASYTADDCTPPPVECDEGETPADTDDDQVDDTCLPVECDEGETASDSGGNGVDDTCTQVLCDAGETPTDTGDNGVDDTCLPVECDEGETASDSGANGVDDTCTEAPTTTTTAPPTTLPPTTLPPTPTTKPTTEVLPSTVRPPASLPQTGTDTVVLAGIGAIILLAGFGMTQTGRLLRAEARRDR